MGDVPIPPRGAFVVVGVDANAMRCRRTKLGLAGPLGCRRNGGGGWTGRDRGESMGDLLVAPGDVHLNESGGVERHGRGLLVSLGYIPRQSSMVCPVAWILRGRGRQDTRGGAFL